MKELLNKITSYNLFNFLLPGTLFALISQEFTSYPLIQENLVMGAFVYYFIGIIISRFGSLVIEPILKKFSFIKLADYEEFVSASKNDPKITILSETNNMYRTFSSMLILLSLLKLYELIGYKLPVLEENNVLVLIVLLFIMFVYSYRKQTNYITKRIRSKG